MERIQKATLRRLLEGIDLRGRSVLELGCGVARWAPFFLERGAHYQGCDIASPMLEAARRRAPESRFRLSSSSAIPAPGSRFDLTASITVLHHNETTTKRALAAELIRVTRPGGHILVLEGLRTGLRNDPNMFPLTTEGWRELFRTGADLRRQVHTRWWPTRDFLAFVARKFALLPAGSSRARRPRPNPSLPESLALHLGRLLDPWLLRWLPKKHATNVGLLWERSRSRGVNLSKSARTSASSKPDSVTTSST